MKQERSDPVQRADERKKELGDGDVREKADGTVEQREQGNMDASMVPKGKDHPDEGPYSPEDDLIDPETSPGASADHPTSKPDSAA